MPRHCLVERRDKELCLLELTISFKSVVADSRQYKRTKYEDLVVYIIIAGCAAGFMVTLLCIEVGSRGMLDDAQFDALEIIV